jgi:hypothetical protein
MKSESFRAVASTAIDEGSRERRATAQRPASQFETARTNSTCARWSALEKRASRRSCRASAIRTRFRTGKNRSALRTSDLPPFRSTEGITAGRFREAVNRGGSSELSYVDGLRVSALSPSARSFSEF